MLPVERLRASVCMPHSGRRAGTRALSASAGRILVLPAQASQTGSVLLLALLLAASVGLSALLLHAAVFLFAVHPLGRNGFALVLPQPVGLVPLLLRPSVFFLAPFSLFRPGVALVGPQTVRFVPLLLPFTVYFLTTCAVVRPFVAGFSLRQIPLGAATSTRVTVSRLPLRSVIPHDHSDGSRPLAWWK